MKTRYLLGYSQAFKQCDNKQLWIGDSKTRSFILSYNTIIGYITWSDKILHTTRHWYSVTTTQHKTYLARKYGLVIKYDFLDCIVE